MNTVKGSVRLSSLTRWEWEIVVYDEDGNAVARFHEYGFPSKSRALLSVRDFAKGIDDQCLDWQEVNLT